VTAGVRSMDSGGSGRGAMDAAAGLLGRVANRKNGLRLASLLFVGLVWELWGSANPFFASHPSAIGLAASETLFPLVLPAFITTLTALLVGLAIATPIGIVVGFAMGRVRLLDVALTPYINAIYATPRIALIPVLVLWLGIDFNLRITIVALGAVFPVMINTYAGAKHVDPELLDTGRSFTASENQLLRTIVAPSSLPFIFAGFRIGIGRGVSGVIVAEMTSALTGIGRLMIEDAKYLQIDEVFVSIMVLGLFSLVLFDIVARVQRRLTPWSEVERLK
jgi:ABC-type nitrate/sulfonate/bicarbonate transport system permease component